MKQIIPWTLVILLSAVLVYSYRHSFSGSEASAAQKKKPSAYEKGWEVYDSDQLIKARKKGGRAYMPFLRTPALYCGIYSLKANAKDGQSPHKDDEVYYVLSGKGKIETGAGDKRRTAAVNKGSVIYIKAGVEHRFVDISEDLDLLVFFSTAKAKK